MSGAADASPARRRSRFLPLGRQRLLWVALLAGAALSLGIYHHLPWLNGPPQWKWPWVHERILGRALAQSAARFVLGAIVLGGALLLVRRRLRRPAARRAAGLATLILWGLYAQWTLYAVATPLGPLHSIRIVRDEIAFGYFGVAAALGDRLPPLPEFLRRYPQYMPALPPHASTKPPGPVVACRALRRLFETAPRLTERIWRLAVRLDPRLELAETSGSRADCAAAFTLAQLLMLAGLSAAWPLHALVRRSGGLPWREPAAWCAAWLWVHYPALAIFHPQFDQLYPLLALGALLCLARAIDPRQPAAGLPPALGLGLLLTLGLLLSFTMLFLIPLVLIPVPLAAARRARSWRLRAIADQLGWRRPWGRRVGRALAAAGFIPVAVLFILRASLGFDWIDTFLTALRHQHGTLLRGIERSYATWLGWNLYDFLLFAGGTVATFGLVFLGGAVRRGWRRPRRLLPIWFAFPFVLLLLDLSGLTPGETGRIWLFLAPGLVWAAAIELARRARAGWPTALFLVLLAQWIFLLVLRTRMHYIGW
ncbi:MAG TPA: hypothetical protein PLS90_04865 [Candidatus Sumerlaeota bacterium]|nr:hypothetical protein [Candidatus Sumerlaeota bacterium]